MPDRVIRRKLTSFSQLPGNLSFFIWLCTCLKAGLKLLEPKRVCYTPKSMSRLKVYLVGRHSCCDFQLDDRSVSRKHAEIVPLADGRFYLTDRNSTHGTFVLESGNWKKIRQAFVEPSQSVRLGRKKIKVASFNALRAKNLQEPGISISKAGSPAPDTPPKLLPKDYGVKRNPETGEVVIRPRK